MSKFRLFLSILWIGLGLIYWSMSGSANASSHNELFTFAARGMIFFIMCVLAVISVLRLIKIIYSLLAKNYKTNRNDILHLAAQFIAIALCISGNQVSRQNVLDSEKQGDALIQAIEVYKTTHGSYPAVIDSPEFQTYTPTFKNSQFYYTLINANEFSIRYAGSAFMMCKRYNIAPNWHCDSPDVRCNPPDWTCDELHRRSLKSHS